MAASAVSHAEVWPTIDLTEPVVIDSGRATFARSCSVGYCHGKDGRAGRGPRFRGRKLDREYMFRSIAEGVPGSSMASWKPALNDAQIWAIIAYIETLSELDPLEPLSRFTLFAPCGFVPEGGSCRQRGNLERTRIRGLEADLSVLDRNGWSLSLAYLFSDSEVRRANEKELEDKQLAQVPKHRFQSTLRYIRPTIAEFSLGLRYVGKQFEDDLNSLELSPYATVDLAVSKELSRHYDLFVNLENLFDTEIEVGRSGDLVAIGAPRRVFAGIHAKI